MKLLMLVLLFAHFAYASDDKTIIHKLDIIEHEFRGCPINSICSKKMGEKLLDWEKVLKKTTIDNRLKVLKSYNSKHGIPLQFLAKKEVMEDIDPVMYSSNCKLHNPRNPNNNIYRSTQFFNELPSSKDIVFNKVILYDENEKIEYKLPYHDQVILIKDNKLVSIKDYDDYYFQYSIDPKGKVDLVNFPYSIIEKANHKNIRDAKCPEKMDFNDSYFEKTFCQKIYDIDSNKLKMIQMTWSCS